MQAFADRHRPRRGTATIGLLLALAALTAAALPAAAAEAPAAAPAASDKPAVPAAPAPAPAAAPVPRPPVEVATVDPLPADVGSIDGILQAFYDVISGPAGQPRQWARDRTLYVPGVRLVTVGVGPKGRPFQRVLDHQAYVELANPGFLKNGFFEREIHRVTKRFGNLVHVFSTYESRSPAADSPVVARGVNSLQLVYDGNRWWIASAVWDSERPDNPIPADLLP